MTRLIITASATVETDMDEERVREYAESALNDLAEDNGLTIDDITVKEAVSA